MPYRQALFDAMRELGYVEGRNVIFDVRTGDRGTAKLPPLVDRHITQARQVVRMLLEGRLVCQPFEDAREYGYTFTATGTYRRLGVPVADSVKVVGGGPNGIR